MTTTYRAAVFYRHRHSAGVPLTSPEEASLEDAELRNAALAEARQVGLIGEDQEANQITVADLLGCLHIENWTE